MCDLRVPYLLLVLFFALPFPVAHSEEETSNAAANTLAPSSSMDDELTKRIYALEQQVLKLSAQAQVPPTQTTLKSIQSIVHLKTELGPTASKIYFDPGATWQLGVSSEVFTFQEKRGAEGSAEAINRANVLSVAPVLSFRLHPRLIFNSQFLFENGGSEASNTVTLQKGQSVITQAYVDWLADERGQAGVRVGHQLIPLGWVNTRSEPVTYLSVLKPELERELIPSSWHENGVTFWVDRPRADIQIGVFNSLNAGDFKGETFLAGGRSQGQNAPADDFMITSRINMKLNHLTIGGSLAFGNSAQGDPGLSNATFNLSELHFRFHLKRFELLGMLARGQVGDAEAISILNSTTMGQMARGSQLQAAFDLIRGDQSIWVFGRYSRYNLHEQVPTGYTADPELDKSQVTYGLAYFPIPQVTLKMDYSLRTNEAKSAEDEFALGLGLVF